MRRNKKFAKQGPPQSLEDTNIRNHKAIKFKSEKVKYRHKNHWLKEADIDLKYEEE